MNYTFITPSRFDVLVESNHTDSFVVRSTQTSEQVSEKNAIIELTS